MPDSTVNLKQEAIAVRDKKKLIQLIISIGVIFVAIMIMRSKMPKMFAPLSMGCLMAVLTYQNHKQSGQKKPTARTLLFLAVTVFNFLVGIRMLLH